MEKYLPGGYLENRRRLLRAVATMAVAARAREEVDFMAPRIY